MASRFALLLAVWVAANDGSHYLQENQISKWWNGQQSTAEEFTLWTSTHTEQLFVYVTDLRSSHADGHGAGATVKSYDQDQNITFTIVSPSIGAGYLSVVATFGGGAIELVAGEPVHVVLSSKNQVALFKFATTANAEIVTIALTPFLSEAKPCALISNFSAAIVMNDTSTFQYKIYSHVNVAVPGDAIQTFYILTQNTKLGFSRFYITASTLSTHVMLQSGVPRTEDVDFGYSRHYYFNVTEANCMLALILSVIDGDPDLFVSADAAFKYPNITHNDFASDYFGSDYILIKNASIAMYYVTVQPALERNAKYTLSSILKCAHEKYFTYLIDGIAQSDVLADEQFSFYKFEFNFDGSVDEILIQINPSFGNADLYVALDRNDSSSFNAQSAFQWPFKSDNYGADHLRLSPTEWYSICARDPSNDTFCTVDIAVYGSQSCVYSLLVSTSETHIVLANGKPYVGYVSAANAYQYYMFDIEDMRSLLRANNISVSLTPMVSTSEAIVTRFYVDGDANPMPNELNGYAYASWDTDHPYLIIDGEQVVDNLFSVLYIGVSSDRNISFTIVLTVGNEVQLSNGQLQMGHVDRLHSAYYEFFIDDTDDNNQDLEFIATVFHGDVNMYVGSQVVPNPANATSYDFANMQRSISIKRIVVNNTANAHKFCVQHLCRYYVTICTRNDEIAEFAVLATTNGGQIPLFDGQPISLQVSGSQYEYFSISVDYAYKDKPALEVTVTPMSGDVDIYVSDDEGNHRPNATHCNFRSEQRGSATDDVQVAEAKPVTYYISVYAVAQDVIFSITATLSNPLSPGFIRLLSGVPTNGYIRSFGHPTARYYQIYVPEVATLLSIHLHHSLFSIDMYATRNISQLLPSASNFDYHKQTGTLNIVNPKEGSVYIAIYAHYVTAFTITATLSRNILMLQDGQSVNGEVKRNLYDYYLMQVHDVSHDLTVSLTCFSGDADLYIAVNDASGSTRPNSTSYDWRSDGYGSDTLTISHDDPRSCNQTDCAYILAVYGFRNAIYTITASTEQVVTLQDGIPIQSEVKDGQWHYYKFMASDEALTLTVGINLVSGQCDMYIMLGKEPSAVSFLFRTLSWDQDKTVHFQHLACPNNEEMCAYYIGVYGATESTYSVFVQSADSNTAYLLQDGVPISRQIDAGQFLYFKYRSVDALDYVTVSLTPVSGSPECYISDSDAVQRPFRNDYTYKMVDGANSLQITNFTANDTVFYFSVFAQVSSAFALSVIGEQKNRSADATGVQLVEGKIQFGSTDDWSYYSFTPSNSMQTDIIIAVYSVSGDPDIYCNIDAFPTLTRFLYSANLDGPETLRIPHRNQTYFCGVHADNDAITDFYILAYHAHSIVTLLDDIPVIGQLDDANNVNYYHFVAPDVDSDEHGTVSIILTPIYSRPCVMYVSHETYRPNATAYEYKMNSSINHGLNALNLKISKQDLSVAADWYISVQPVVDSASAAVSDQSVLYTLILTYDNVSTLSPGLPQTGIVTAEHEAYYIWHVDLSYKESGKPMVIDVSLLTGNCTIFMSRNPSLLNSCNNGIGCPIGLVDAQQTCTRNEPFVIHPRDAYYITQGTYYISVCSEPSRLQDADASPETYYTIFASTAYALIYLSNGVPLWDYIELDEYRYYSLLCDEENMIGLDVSVTPNSDDGTCSFKLDGIVSVNRSRPVEPVQDGEYSTMWVDSNGALFSMETEDARFTKASQYFIAIHAVSADSVIAQGVDALSMTYSIVAVASYSDFVEYRVLINDAEQMAMIENTDSKRYYAFQSEDAQNIKFTIFCAQGKISMYVISDERLNHKTEHDGPSSDHFDYKLESLQQQSGTKNIVVRDPCKQCAYLVVIYASKQSVFVIRANAYSFDESASNNTKTRLSKGEKVAIYVGITIVCVIVAALCTFFGFSYRKNKRLTYELDVAELQLNMGGVKSLRQRREDLQSVNQGPAQPIYSDNDELGDKQQTKRKKKNKYVELQDDNVENDEAFDNPILFHSNNKANI